MPVQYTLPGVTCRPSSREIRDHVKDMLKGFEFRQASRDALRKRKNRKYYPDLKRNGRNRVTQELS